MRRDDLLSLDSIHGRHFLPRFAHGHAKLRHACRSAIPVSYRQVCQKLVYRLDKFSLGRVSLNSLERLAGSASLRRYIHLCRDLGRSRQHPKRNGMGTPDVCAAASLGPPSWTTGAHVGPRGMARGWKGLPTVYDAATPSWSSSGDGWDAPTTRPRRTTGVGTPLRYACRPSIPLAASAGTLAAGSSSVTGRLSISRIPTSEQRTRLRPRQPLRRRETLCIFDTLSSVMHHE